jgi:hypothetical protein
MPMDVAEAFLHHPKQCSFDRGGQPAKVWRHVERRHNPAASGEPFDIIL